MYLRFHKGIVLDVGFKQKRKIPENGLFKPFSRTCVWQGHKDSNSGHAVLERNKALINLCYLVL